MNEVEEQPVEELPPQTKTSADLSVEVATSMNRLRGEVVKCVRVSANHYRCNWWGKPDGDFSDRIVRSAFLRAKKTPAGLEVEEISHARKYPAMVD